MREKLWPERLLRGSLKNLYKKCGYTEEKVSGENRFSPDEDLIKTPG